MIPIIKINDYTVAKLFKDRLNQKLRNPVEMESEADGYTIFIDENELETARDIVIQVTTELRENERRARERNIDEWADNGSGIIKPDFRKRTRSGQDGLLSQIRGAAGPFTLAVALLMSVTYAAQLVAPEYTESLLMAAGFVPSQPETWYRLVTPVLMHFGIMHFMFNLVLWIWAGGMIEKGLGAPILAVLFFLGAIIPDFAQLHFSGAFFGGLSGIIYALICFCWITAFMKPEQYASTTLPPGLMAFSVIFAVIGLFDIIPGTSMANTVHFSGIAIGLLFGLYHASFLAKPQKG